MKEDDLELKKVNPSFPARDYSGKRLTLIWQDENSYSVREEMDIESFKKLFS